MIHSTNSILSLLHTYCLLAKNSYLFKFRQRRSGSSKNLENSSVARAPPRTMRGSLQCSPRLPSRLRRGHFGCGGLTPPPPPSLPQYSKTNVGAYAVHIINNYVLVFYVYPFLSVLGGSVHQCTKNEPEYLQMSIL